MTRDQVLWLRRAESKGFISSDDVQVFMDSLSENQLYLMYTSSLKGKKSHSIYHDLEKFYR
jgi:hypothetical protein